MVVNKFNKRQIKGNFSVMIYTSVICRTWWVGKLFLIDVVVDVIPIFLLNKKNDIFSVKITCEKKPFIVH